jgi:PIN domain nuclease of toxin-antitoxin system
VLLLDTCTLIWLTSSPDQISPAARAAIDSEEKIAISDVSVWEISLKWQAGKIELPTPPRLWIATQSDAWMFDEWAIEREDLFRAAELPNVHRDPFDRLLIAQAIIRNARIVSPDPAIRKYPVGTIW